MTRQNINSKPGFTIIEVVLVLAIAGLIFLMVFVAFPAVQRSQHDTRRTDDIGRVQSALINWQNNHNNNLPGPKDKNDDSDSFDANVQAPDGIFGEECKNQACQFVRDYMNSAATTNTNGQVINTFEDPSGEYYNLVVTRNISGEAAGSLGTVSFAPTNNPEAIMNLEYSDEMGGYTLNGQLDSYAIFIVPGATCSEDYAVKSTKNNFAVLYRMEGSGVKCTNNGS